ncbi:MAG: NADH-quinone oxidoreductase subunit N, partial [Desulfovibrionales bacterium]
MDFALITPEIYLLLVIAVLFVQSLLGGNASRSITWLPYAAGVGIVVTFLGMSGRGVMFFDAYQLDGLSQFFKLAVSGGLFIAVLNAQRQPTLEEDKRSDYYLFMCLSAWGLMLLSSAAELITIYLALELASYSLYALVPLRAKDRRAAEAGIKYILFGAVATAIALYGFSYILAAQQTTYLSDLALLSWSWADSPMAVAGLTMFLAGMFYKLALFPFHFWCPDVYEGASNETATYIATLPKLGAVVILIRLVAMLDPGHEIITILAILSALSMTYGNLSALAQKDLKRILGYSSVAHAGY